MIQRIEDFINTWLFELTQRVLRKMHLADLERDHGNYILNSGSNREPLKFLYHWHDMFPLFGAFDHLSQCSEFAKVWRCYLICRTGLSCNSLA